MIIEAQTIAEIFKGVPGELVVLIISMTPIFELRGSLPLAMGYYDMALPNAYFLSVIGNIVPVVLISFFFDPTAKWLCKHFDFFNKFFNWLFDRTRRRADGKIKKYGPWGLFFLVAIPLPITGGWTGALAAFLFGIKRRIAIPVISLGIMAAGIIVALITIGAISL